MLKMYEKYPVRGNYWLNLSLNCLQDSRVRKMTIFKKISSLSTFAKWTEHSRSVQRLVLRQPLPMPGKQRHDHTQKRCKNGGK